PGVGRQRAMVPFPAVAQRSAHALDQGDVMPKPIEFVLVRAMPAEGKHAQRTRTREDDRRLPLWLEVLLQEAVIVVSLQIAANAPAPVEDRLVRMPAPLPRLQPELRVLFMEPPEIFQRTERLVL